MNNLLIIYELLIFIVGSLKDAYCIASIYINRIWHSFKITLGHNKEVSLSGQMLMLWSRTRDGTLEPPNEATPADAAAPSQQTLSSKYSSSPSPLYQHSLHSYSWSVSRVVIKDITCTNPKKKQYKTPGLCSNKHTFISFYYLTVNSEYC